MSKAVFLDRDGTILDDPGYLSNPEQVKLLPGADLAIKSLRQAGYKIVVITNQSGIARGMFTEDDLAKIHAEMKRQLEARGATIDAIYYCPYHPEGQVEQYAKRSELRKPAPGMLLKAAGEMGLDLANSWMVGDKPDDVAAGRRAGCKTIRLHFGQTAEQTQCEQGEEHQPDAAVQNLVEAAKVILHDAGQSVLEQGQTESAVSSDNAPAETTLPKPGATIAAAATSAPADSGLLTMMQPPSEPAQPLEYASADDELPQPIEAPAEESRFAQRRREAREAAGDESDIRREILKYVRQISRQADHEEFSVTNLLGGVFQIVVILFLVLAITKFSGESPQRIDEATFWAIIAVVFQAMSLTFFIMSQKRK